MFPQSTIETAIAPIEGGCEHASRSAAGTLHEQLSAPSSVGVRYVCTRTSQLRPTALPPPPHFRRTTDVSLASQSLHSARPASAALLVLAASALSMLLIGTLVYLLDRPAGTAWLLPTQWQSRLQLSSPSRFGDIGGWLPSFAHGFAFSMLTALLLPLRRRFAAAACMGWALVDGLAEVGQHSAVSGWLARLIESAFGGSPWAAQVGRYFSRGVFDPADLAAGLAGCGLAYLALHVTVLRHRRRPLAVVHPESS